MSQSTSVFGFGSDFDDFLSAPIGQERNGMVLSVVSALARQGLDPWEEAAKLALLPVEVARRRLASFIAAFPVGPSTHLDSETIAARLIALLPQQAPRKISLRAGAATSFRGVVCVVLLTAILVTLLLSGTGHQAPEPLHKVDPATAADTVSP